MILSFLDPFSIGGPISGAVAGAIANAIFSAFEHWLASAAQGLVDNVMSATTSVAPTEGNGWFAGARLDLYPIELFVMAPLLFAATIGALVRQDMARLGRIWGAGLPLAALGGYAIGQLAFSGVAATDALSSFIEAEVDPHLGRDFGDAVAMALSPGPEAAVYAMVAIVVIFGALAVWLELALRGAAVELAIFFMPLAFAGLVWPSTAIWAKRLLHVLAALLIAKPVIVGALSLGANAFSSSGRGISSAVTGAAMLLMAAFMPLAVLKLIPLAEVSAIAHLQGVARQPLLSFERSVERLMSVVTRGAAVASAGSTGGLGPGEPGSPSADQLIAQLNGSRARAEASGHSRLGPAEFPEGQRPRSGLVGARVVRSG
jgi:hypothetical protein